MSGQSWGVALLAITLLPVAALAVMFVIRVVMDAFGSDVSAERQNAARAVLVIVAMVVWVANTVMAFVLLAGP